MELHDCVRGRARSAVTISISIHSHKKMVCSWRKADPSTSPKEERRNITTQKRRTTRGGVAASFFRINVKYISVPE